MARARTTMTSGGEAGDAERGKCGRTSRRRCSRRRTGAPTLRSSDRRPARGRRRARAETGRSYTRDEVNMRRRQRAVPKEFQRSAWAPAGLKYRSAMTLTEGTVTGSTRSPPSQRVTHHGRGARHPAPSTTRAPATRNGWPARAAVRTARARSPSPARGIDSALSIRALAPGRPERVRPSTDDGRRRRSSPARCPTPTPETAASA